MVVLNMNKFFVKITGFIGNDMGKTGTSTFLFKGFDAKDDIQRFLKDYDVIRLITSNKYQTILSVEVFEKESELPENEKAIPESIIVKDTYMASVYQLPDVYRPPSVFDTEDLLIIRIKPASELQNDTGKLDRIAAIEAYLNYPFIGHVESWVLDYNSLMGDHMYDGIVSNMLKNKGIHHLAFDMHLINLHEITMLRKTFFPKSEKTKMFDSVHYYVSGKADTDSDFIYELPYMKSDASIILNRVYPTSGDLERVATPIAKIWK